MPESVTTLAAGHPRVSVVVPVYNAEKHLDTCIEGLLAQTYPAQRMELLFVDDGSSDGSAGILARHRQRITCLSLPHRGAPSARNAGIRRARHALIASTDADCVATPHWLERLVRAAEANPQADFLGGRVVAFRPTTRVERFTETLFDQEAAVRNAFPYVLSGNMLVRRDFLIRLGLFDEQCPRAHDAELSRRGLFHQGATFAYVDDAVVGHVHCRTLRELFLKGIKHGRGSAYVQGKYATELRVKQPGRWFREERFRAIAANVRKAAERGLARARRQDEADCLYPLLQALFDLGKEVGFAWAKLSRPRTRPLNE